MQNNFKWWYALIGYMAYIFSFMFNTFLSTIAQDWFEGSTINSGPLFNALMFIVGGLVCMILLRLFSRSSLSRYDFGITHKGLSRAIWVGGILGILFFGLSEFIESNNKNLKAASEEVMKAFNLGQNFTSDLILLLNIGLFAPVVEEILFRGAIFNPIYQSLKTKASFPHWAALGIGLGVSTLLFVFSHGGGGQDAQLGLLGLLSILAGLGMYITKSLFGAIMVHAVNNNLVFIFMVHNVLGLGSTHGMKLVLASVLSLLLCIPIGLLFGRILPR